MWLLFCYIVIIIVILSTIPMAIIGIQKMNKGELDNYFVHRIVSGRIWRHIKDENLVTVLSFKVRCFLVISHVCTMIALLTLLIWMLWNNSWTWHLWPSFICFTFAGISIVFQILANRAFKLDCSSQRISA